MSLFSRLDRVRAREREESESKSGMFSVPDLGERGAEQAPVSEPAAPTDATSPEVDSTAASAQDASPEVFSPVTAPRVSPSSPLQTAEESAVEETPSHSSQIAAQANLDALAHAEPVEPQAETETGDLEDVAADSQADETRETQVSEPEAITPEAITPEAATPEVTPAVSEAPLASEAPVAPVVSEETPRSPFDRLMAARMAKSETVEAPEPPAPAPAAPPVISVVSEPQSQFQPAPPLDEATLDTPLDIASGEASANSAEAVTPPSPMSNYSPPRSDEDKPIDTRDSSSESGPLGNRFRRALRPAKRLTAS